MACSKRTASSLHLHACEQRDDPLLVPESWLAPEEWQVTPCTMLVGEVKERIKGGSTAVGDQLALPSQLQPHFQLTTPTQKGSAPAKDILAHCHLPLPRLLPVSWPHAHTHAHAHAHAPTPRQTMHPSPIPLLYIPFNYTIHSTLSLSLTSVERKETNLLNFFFINFLTIDFQKIA